MWSNEHERIYTIFLMIWHFIIDLIGYITIIIYWKWFVPIKCIVNLWVVFKKEKNVLYLWVIETIYVSIYIFLTYYISKKKKIYNIL